MCPHLTSFKYESMKKIIILFVALMSFSCNQKVANGIVRHTEKRFNFPLTTVTSDFDEKEVFTVLLPKSGKKEKHYPHFGKIYTEYRVYYRDSSTFYISNDIWNGSQLNAGNLYEIGIRGHTKEDFLDTVSYHGLQENGRYWEETMLGEVVVGYSNVPRSRKEEFDKAVSSVKKVN